MTLETQKLATQATRPISFWDRLIMPNASISNLAEQRQARLSAVLAMALVLFNLIAGFLTANGSTSSLLQFFGIPAILSLIAYFIIRTKYFSIGSFLLVAALCATGYLNIAANNLEISIGLLFYIPFVLTVGSAIVNAWPLVVLTVLNIFTIIFLTSAGIRMPNNISLIIGLIALFGFVLALINNFRKNIETQQVTELQKINREAIDARKNIQVQVEQRSLVLDRRSSRLESAALVARAATEIRDLHELLDTVARQISERFGFYHVGIFLADEDNRQLNLVAASSIGGLKMIARGHKLGIGREGIVGFTAAQKHPRIAQSVEADAIFLTNPDLPTTRSEVALPLLTQTRLVGVLDIQSEEENAFTSDDVTTLQTMTDQIAMAIENIRLFELNRSALHTMQSTNITNMTTAWHDKLSGQVLGFTYTPLGIEPLKEDNNLGDKYVRNERTMKIPIILRGKEIGAISLLRSPNEAHWTETEREMAQGIATQLGLSIDNARLLEEAQVRAVREQTINEFSNLISQSLDIDTLLQKAVREIYRMPQVSQVSLFINPDQENLKQ